MPRIKPIGQNEITAAVEAAYRGHAQQHNGRITNMKATMGRSLPVFDVYMRWYDLYESVKAIVGSRAAYLFCHAISTGSNCPLCTTYFRKIMIEKGENPEDLQLTETEQALIDFGSSIGGNKGEVATEVYNAVKQNYSDAQIVLLVGFAGQMVATNIFNNVLQVEIDEYLAPYVDLSNKD